MCVQWTTALCNSLDSFLGPNMRMQAHWHWRTHTQLCKTENPTLRPAKKNKTIYGAMAAELDMQRALYSATHSVWMSGCVCVPQQRQIQRITNLCIHCGKGICIESSKLGPHMIPHFWYSHGWEKQKKCSSTACATHQKQSHQHSRITRTPRTHIRARQYACSVSKLLEFM